MIISERQIMQLIEIARTKLNEIQDKRNESYAFIVDLLTEIHLQQSTELKEITQPYSWPHENGLSCGLDIIPGKLSMNWISAVDEKPPYLKKVLFLWICPGGNKNVSMGYLCSEGWDIYLPFHSYKLNNEILTITHWMDLPEFPNE